MTKRLVALALTLIPSLTDAQPTRAADSSAIRRAALDYIEGWYNGDSVRMRRAVHPALAKRVPLPVDAAGRSRLSNMGADALVRGTGAGGGKDTPPEKRVADFSLLALDGDISTVRLRSAQFIDYMHLVRSDGEWKIINVLWDYLPESRPKPPAYPTAITVTGDQFKSLAWITGNFVGTGSANPFYEGLRFVDDSTIEVRYFKDSTFTSESSPRALMTLRGGRVTYDGAVVTAMTPSSIRFDSAPLGSHYFTFQRGSVDGHWTATIEGRSPAGEARKSVYDMRRQR